MTWLRRLRTKILGVILVMTTVGVAGSAGTLIDLFYRDKRDYLAELGLQTAQSASALLSITRETLPESLREGPVSLLLSQGATLKPLSEVDSVTLAVAEEWAQKSRGQPTEIGALQGTLRPESGGEFFVTWAPIRGPEKSAVISVIRTKGASALVRASIQRLWPFLIALIIIAVLFGWLLSKWISRPLEELRQATFRLGQGEWNLDLQKRTPDEIGDLFDAFSLLGQELKKREADLQTSWKKLARTEKLAAVGTLSAGVAHEVKNPLSSILGFAQLLLKHTPAATDEKTGKYLGFIVEETRRANQIVMDLLTFARQKPPSRTADDWVVTLRRSAEMLTASGTEGQRVIYFGPETIHWKHDREQIHQVLANLTQNAFHAGAKNVTFSAKAEGDALFLKIHDDGAGVPEDVIPHLFEPFFSTKETGKGTGLGLSIVHGIIEAHGGTIAVTSPPGDGTLFTLRFRKDA